MIHYITTNGIGNVWVGNELRIVDREGIPFVLHGMRAPHQYCFKSEWADRLHKSTRTIYPIPVFGMIVSILAAPFLFGTRFFAALGNAIFGKREHLRARVATLAHFFVACHWARSLRHDDVSHIHAQWAHSSGSIGMYGAWLLGKNFSFTGHASDLFPDRAALEDKIRRADFIVCISEFHRKFYLDHGARPEQLHVVYCGIYVDEMVPGTRKRALGEPIRIRSSGRLVGKKGFEYLVDACKILKDRGVNFECQIAGSGPLEKMLRDRIAQHNLGERVTLTGKEIKQEEIPAFMHSGDVYVLACVWAKDGDIDGLPQMLMEAMACGLPAISTNLVGIPDLIIDDETGLLVDPENVPQLADAIAALANDPAKADRLARRGREYIMEKFEIHTALQPLVRLYRTKLAGTRSSAASTFETPAAPIANPTGVTRT
jgi:colanic acid/amylovoran biosynthesis glycosyltransferase